MSYGLYISAEGAAAQSRRLEVISNNLANVDTVGFKRDVAQFQARFAEAIELEQDLPGSRSVNDVGGGVMVDETRTDFSPGTLKSTGQLSDMAIRGDGFFVVEKAGERYLTRAGNFLVTSEGNLQTQQGFAVLNDSGAPINIDPSLGPWSLTSDGAIQQSGTLNFLALELPDSPTAMVKVGENLFAPLTATRPLEPGLRRVETGYLEYSGVQPTTEMMQLIEATRAFEANVNLIRNQDQMLGSLLGRLMRSN